MEVVENKALVFDTSDPEVVTSRIQKSKIVKSDGDTHTVAVRWGLDEAEELQRLVGHDVMVPSPITRDYDWPGMFTPMSHQTTTASMLTVNKRAFCFNDAGTGKTAAVIWASDYLMKQGKVNRVLIVCPLSIMNAAWRADLFSVAMHRHVGIAYGDAKKRAAVINSNAEYVVINYDGMGTVLKELANGGFDLIIADEATALKNTSTTRWKNFKALADRAERIWLLTATPRAQSPMDAYGLAKLVNPHNTPKFQGSFRDKVMYPITRFKWAPKPGSNDYVYSLLQPAIRFTKKDCLDLPPVTHVTREAPLTAQQTSYYKKMLASFTFDVGQTRVSSVNAATQINKLLQISSGAVYAEDGSTVQFDVSNRLRVVQEAIEGANFKTLVFVPFRHTIDLLSAHLTKEGIINDVIDGRTPMAKRSIIIDDFQKTDNVQVLILQPQAAAHGITLTAADTTIWYAPVTSVETYLQANARIDRKGQKNAMTIVHVCGSKAEEKVYSMLAQNVSAHNALVDLYESIAQVGV